MSVTEDRPCYVNALSRSRVAHDLGQVSRIVRVMARHDTAAVWPWPGYLVRGADK